MVAAWQTSPAKVSCTAALALGYTGAVRLNAR